MHALNQQPSVVLVAWLVVCVANIQQHSTACYLAHLGVVQLPHEELNSTTYLQAINTCDAILTHVRERYKATVPQHLLTHQKFSDGLPLVVFYNRR